MAGCEGATQACGMTHTARGAEPELELEKMRFSGRDACSIAITQKVRPVGLFCREVRLLFKLTRLIELKPRNP